MVEQFTFQTVFQFLQTIGILVGVSYYVVSLRNQDRARQVQTFNIIMNRFADADIDMMNEVMSYEWDDYNDFEEKYGGNVNIKKSNMRYTCWHYWDSVGYLLKKGLVDRDVIYLVNSTGGAHWMWNKFESVIKEIRVRYNMPHLGANWEYMVEEHYKMMRQRGLSTDIPEGYGSYFPDQASNQ
jgi:hypothetical protein